MISLAFRSAIDAASDRVAQAIARVRQESNQGETL